MSQLALQNEMAMVRAYDEQISQVDEQLKKHTRKVAARDYTLLQTAPGIGKQLGLTILYDESRGESTKFNQIQQCQQFSTKVNRLQQPGQPTDGLEALIQR